MTFEPREDCDRDRERRQLRGTLAHITLEVLPRRRLLRACWIQTDPLPPCAGEHRRPQGSDLARHRPGAARYRGSARELNPADAAALSKAQSDLSFIRGAESTVDGDAEIVQRHSAQLALVAEAPAQCADRRLRRAAPGTCPGSGPRAARPSRTQLEGPGGGVRASRCSPACPRAGLSGVRTGRLSSSCSPERLRRFRSCAPICDI